MISFQRDHFVNTEDLVFPFSDDISGTIKGISYIHSLQDSQRKDLQAGRPFGPSLQISFVNLYDASTDSPGYQEGPHGSG